MEYRYTGIILNKQDIGETDRIYTIYTLEGGKIRSVAKGVRKAEAKLASSLENLTLADIIIVRTRGLGKITGSIVEQNFSFLKRDCDALLVVFSVMAIFDKMVDLDNSDTRVFQLLSKYLETMDSLSEKQEEEKYETISLGFLVKLLDYLGYAIEVDKCVVCDSKLSQENICFSPQHGGTLCLSCGKEMLTACFVKQNGIKLLRLFFKNSLSSLVKIKVQKEDMSSAKIAVHDFIRWNT
jgi:DNA repair protein RecO (recombination protein O)